MVAAPVDPDGTVRRHAVVAAVLSFMAYGLGQIYAGRPRWAAYLIGSWFAVMALFWTDIPSTFFGFALLMTGFLAVTAVSVVHAFATAWRHPTTKREPYHRWYVYVAYAVAFNAVALGLINGAFASIGLPSPFGPYKPFRAASESMSPTLLPGDYFLAEMGVEGYRPGIPREIGDVVVYRWPDEDSDYVHRLMAKGGDRLSITDGAVSVNGSPLVRRKLCEYPEASDRSDTRWAEASGGRQYVIQASSAFDGGYSELRFMDESEVPQGHFFVMGDSRDNSKDSRFRGPVPDEQYRGRGLFIFWSNDWRRIGMSLRGEREPLRADACPENPP